MGFSANQKDNFGRNFLTELTKPEMSFHKISGANPASDFTSSFFGSQQYAQKTKKEEHVHDQISYMLLLPNNARKIEILKFQCSFIEPPPPPPPLSWVKMEIKLLPKHMIYNTHQANAAELLVGLLQDTYQDKPIFMFHWFLSQKNI